MPLPIPMGNELCDVLVNSKAKRKKVTLRAVIAQKEKA
jgi:hypothetical protein